MGYLWELARSCNTVTEFGTRTAVSTAAFAFAYPEWLHCYDTDLKPEALDLARVAQAAGIDMALCQHNVLQVEIEETDLLFIDTWHCYEQLSAELALHASKVKRYIVMHDTETFKLYGEPPAGERFGQRRGLQPAIEEFLGESALFTLAYTTPKCNGLTVLSRRNIAWEES